MWLICKATIGRGNKLLIRGVDETEWVFCPLIKNKKRDKISTDQCQGCEHFLRFQQTHIPKIHTTKKTSSFKKTRNSTFRITRPSSKLRNTHPHVTSIPSIPNLIQEREPLIDLFEEEDYIIVLAELSSIKIKDVNVNIEEDTLTISVDEPKKIYKTVRFPSIINKNTVQSTYNNNILQLRLEKL